MLRRCYGSKASEIQHKRVRFALGQSNKYKSEVYHTENIFDETSLSAGGGAKKNSASPGSLGEDDKFFGTPSEDQVTTIDGDNNATREEST